MKINKFIIIILLLLTENIEGQNYPVFGNEIPVTINGLSFDAMEPFISPDGNTLFFNSLNDGINTNLYYATKINDSTFNFAGEVIGVNETSSAHLNAVTSQDSANNYFWVSTRNYQAPGYENLMTGNYSAGSVTGIKKVYGDIYIPVPVWIVMDAAISYDGNSLYYCNAYLGPGGNDCGGPCYSQLHIAQKINDSTFNKIAGADVLLAAVNDTSYLIYAPQLSKDGLELYFTRCLKSTYNTEICVSVRTSTFSSFSLPVTIYSSIGFVPEAATVTSDKAAIYYHRRSAFLSGTYAIYLRYRIGATGVKTFEPASACLVFPNPVSNVVSIRTGKILDKAVLSLYNSLGEKVKEIDNLSGAEIIFQPQCLPGGFYFFQVVEMGNLVSEGKLLVNAH